MTAEIYHQEHNLEEATQRLQQLGSGTPERYSREALLSAGQLGYSPNDLQYLADLVQAFSPTEGGTATPEAVTAMRERRERREKSARTPWYLLTGLVLGMAAGAVFSTWWWPVPYDFALPSDLNSTAKDQYRLVIARAYRASSDGGRAYPRLSLLKDVDAAALLASQAQIAVGLHNDIDSEALAMLASGLDPANRVTPESLENLSTTPEPTLAPETTNTPYGIVQQLPTEEMTPEPGTVYPTIAPLNIPSAEIPRATPTMFPTLSAPFILKDRAVDCGQNLRPGLLQIWIENAAGLAMPGSPYPDQLEGRRGIVLYRSETGDQ